MSRVTKLQKAYRALRRAKDSPRSNGRRWRKTIWRTYHAPDIIGPGYISSFGIDIPEEMP